MSAYETRGPRFSDAVGGTELDRLISGLAHGDLSSSMGIGGNSAANWTSLDMRLSASVGATVVPRHWEKAQKTVRTASGKELNLQCLGWSRRSPDEARRVAEGRLVAALAKFEAGERARLRGASSNRDYKTEAEKYSKAFEPWRTMDQDLAQKGIMEMNDISKGAPVDWRAAWAYTHTAERMQPENIISAIGASVVTRNHYGADILNSPDTMFVDIDFGDDEREVERQAAMDRVRMWASVRPDVGIRMYETNAGLRLLLTDQPRNPASSEAQSIMDQLGADEKYARMCASQDCFRARLTPKPWRIGMSDPPARYCRNGNEKRLMASWVTDYEALSSQFSVAHFVEELGSGIVHPQLKPTIVAHDRACVGNGQLA